MRAHTFLIVAAMACAHPDPTSPATPTAQPSSMDSGEAAPQQALPDFSLQTLGDSEVRAEDLAGKVVLINFWESHCGPCKAEFPALETLHQTYQAEGLVVLGVALNERREEAQEIAAQYKLSFPNAYGGESLYRALGGKGTPFSILFDRDHIAAKISGRRTEDFFEGLVWSSLALAPKSRIGAASKSAAKKPAPVAVAPTPPKPLAREANGWSLEQASGYSNNFGAIFGVKRGKGHRAFVGGVGRIFLSDGDGAWRSVYDDPSGLMIEDFWAASETELFAVGAESPILYSSDAGETWTPLGARYDLLSIWGSSVADLYAVGSKGLILHSADKGKTWQEQQSNVSLSLLSIWGSGADDIYIGAAFGIIFHSTDHGKTWQKLDTKSRAAFYDVWGSGADDVYAVGGGADGVVAHSSDRGKTWSTQTLGQGYFGTVLGFSKGDVWISGGGVYRSRDQGKTWEAAPTIPEAPIIFLWGTSADELYTAGPRNTIQHHR